MKPHPLVRMTPDGRKVDRIELDVPGLRRIDRGLLLDELRRADGAFRLVAVTIGPDLTRLEFTRILS